MSLDCARSVGPGGLREEGGLPMGQGRLALVPRYAQGRRWEEALQTACVAHSQEALSRVPVRALTPTRPFPVRLPEGWGVSRHPATSLTRFPAAGNVSLFLSFSLVLSLAPFLSCSLTLLHLLSFFSFFFSLLPSPSIPSSPVLSLPSPLAAGLRGDSSAENLRKANA